MIAESNKAQTDMTPCLGEGKKKKREEGRERETKMEPERGSLTLINKHTYKDNISDYY